MNEQSQLENQQPRIKRISASLALSWILSGLFIFDGAFNLLSRPLVSLIYLLMVLVIFPPFNRFIEKKCSFYFSRGMKILLILVGFIAIGFTIMNKKYETNISAFHISASELCNKYSTNEIMADELYKDKLLEVAGSITKVTKNSVLITGSNIFSVVKCELTINSKDRAAFLEKNQTITVRGFNAGKIREVITLKRCEIINVLKQPAEEDLSQSSKSAVAK